ncbi:MAG TPA: ABC transporter permease subunit [Saprospiraceae bacterium]|nr:ABC transporter permease subunit [Saprospiraceae bacterium]HMP24084.1 ABC transporter permease subunit [Saprospiraceae bacterium]
MHVIAKYSYLTLFILLAGVPLLAGLGYALLYSLGLTGVLNEGFTIVHWYKSLINRSLWQSLGFSFYIAFITMSIAIGLALWAVVRQGEAFRSGYLSFLIYLPLTLPATVIGFYSFQLLAKSGLLSRLGFQAGLLNDLADFPVLVNDSWGVGIIFTHICMATPFLIILFTNLYHNENLKSFAALAQTLGARAPQVIWRVIIPVLLQKSFATLVLYFVFVMSSYEIPLLLGSQSRQMISVFTIEKLQRFNLQDIPQAYAISVLYGMLLIILVIKLLGRNK